MVGHGCMDRQSPVRTEGVQAYTVIAGHSKVGPPLLIEVGQGPCNNAVVGVTAEPWEHILGETSQANGQCTRRTNSCCKA